MPRAPRATIRDVATLARVSRQTVSRATNSPQDVAPETLRRVRDAMAVLDYHPHPGARSLRTTRTGVIGVVVNPNSWFGTNGFTHLEQALRRHDFTMSLAPVLEDDLTEIRLTIRRLLSQGVDGLFLLQPQRLTTDYAATLTATLPIVLVQSTTPTLPGASSVAIDETVGVNAVVAHLVAQGHRRLGHVAGPLDWPSARGRAAAWRAKVQAAGAEALPDRPGDYRPGTGYAAGVYWAEHGLPDAVFAANDLMAMGVLRGFADHGVRVPDDVSLIGYDDLPGIDHLLPRLTTVRQPFELVYAEGMRLLAERMAGGPEEHVRLRPELVLRDSVRRRD